MSYIGNEPIVSATRTVTEVSATAGQTVFTANGGYTVGFIDVFVNGSKLTNSDFTATNGTTITLNEAAQASDIVRLEALGTFLTSSGLTANNPEYTGTLTGGTGVVNIGSGQLYKDGSGNVGIGTSSPYAVGGSWRMLNVGVGGIQGGSSASQSSLLVQNCFYNGSSWQRATTGATGYIDIGGGTIIFSNDSSGSAGTFTPSERMRIDSSGGIWSSTQDQGFQLRSNGTRFGGMYFSNGYLRFQTYQSGNSWMRFEHANGSATEMRDGSVLNTNNSYGGLSDVRFKENIEPARDYLEDLCRVNIVKYSLKSEQSDKPTKLGVIAQEVQQIFPNIVDSDKPNELSVKYSVFVPMLIKAIQEQQAMITELKQRIETLESQ